MTFKNAFECFKQKEFEPVNTDMKTLSQYFENLKLEVIPPDTLFETTFEDLQTACKTQKCLLCGCKLYLMRNRPLYYCKSVKHKKRFIISKEKLDKIAAL